MIGGPSANSTANAAAATTSSTAVIQNNFQTLQIFKQYIVVDNNGAISNALLIPGCSPIWLGTKLATTVVDNDHFNISSSISATGSSGNAEMNNYLTQGGFHCKELQFIVTSGTPQTVYGGSLFMGEMPSTGLPQPQEVLLQPYAQSLGGGGYDPTLTIKNKPFLITPQFYMYLSNIPASTNITVIYYFDYSGNAKLSKKLN